MQKDFAVAIKEVVRAARNTGLWAPREVVHGICSNLSVAVQRGNAAIMSVGINAARRFE